MHARTKKEFEKLLSAIFATRRLVRQKLAVRGGIDIHYWLHLEALRFIGEEQGVTMQGLARHLSITAPSATSLAHKLIHSGFVRRVRGKDRRVVRLEISSRGAREIVRGRRMTRNAFSEVFGELSVSEIRTLVRLMQKAVQTGDGASYRS